MNERLQKKCFVASTGLHLTLLVVFFFGSGFLASRKMPEMQLLEFVPMITTDANASGGGNPNVKPPPSNPLPPTPKPEIAPKPPEPVPVAKPEPAKTLPRTDKPDLRSLEAKPEKKPSKPAVNLKPVVRNNSKPTKPTTSPTTDDNAQARAEAQRRQLAGSIVRNLRENLSPGTTVEMHGPGGGGPTYANYKQVVGSIYFQAWIVPDDVDADAATAVASVTILKNGDVLSASITKSSGNKAVDRSVQATLDRVRFIAPFPEGSKDAQRTFTINFNLKAKKAIG